MKEHTQIPKDALFIIDTLEQHGHEAYVVGGCVRDMIMGREPNDWDITTSAKPEEVKAAVDLSQNTVYLKVRFSCDGKKIKGSEGGHDLIVMCNFSYSLDGKKYE